MKNPFSSLKKSEWILFVSSLIIVGVSFLLSSGDILTLIASLIGVTALIFVAKGMVIGQVLTVVFAVFYGIISIGFRYYGEAITYLGMTSPIAIMSVVSWLRHPYKNTETVEISRLSLKQKLTMIISSIVVTAVFYFILDALGNESILFSTVSITTSFLASYLTLLRSPYYAIAYASNDIVLIVLWIIAAAKDFSCFPMIICFLMFLINDLYGFYNWARMQKKQEGN